MAVKKVKNILYMGCYNEKFNRNAMFINGLENNNINVYQYNVNSHKIIVNLITDNSGITFALLYWYLLSFIYTESLTVWPPSAV